MPDGVDKIEKTITLSDDGKFSVRLEDGTYDLVAVCGLNTDLIGENYSSEIAVPAGADFAVGKTTVTVSGGVCTPSSVSITADRQMAWLDLTVTGVPENIATFELYVKEPCNQYSLDRGWSLSDAGKEKYAKIPLTKADGLYSGSQVRVPCSSTSGVTYVAEATTAGGSKITLTYTSSEPLASGIHLTQTLAYGDLMIVEGEINLNGWTDKTDSGTLVVGDGSGNGSGSGGSGGSGSGSTSYVPGEALPGYPEATVVEVDGNVITIVANEPLRKTSVDLSGMAPLNEISYTSPIPAKRWFILQSSVPEDVDLSNEFMKLIMNSGTARTRLGINTSDLDVMALYRDSSFVTTFNFIDGKTKTIYNSTTSYRCFVFGEMTVE